MREAFFAVVKLVDHLQVAKVQGNVRTHAPEYSLH